VHGIVGDFGGSIDVATEIGVGTIFTIWLPEAGEMSMLPAAPTHDVPRGHGEMAMIVDDEPAPVAIAEEMLAELGYEPLEFDSSIAALQAFHAEPTGSISCSQTRRCRITPGPSLRARSGSCDRKSRSSS
jgi:hypothetical protein